MTISTAVAPESASIASFIPSSFYVGFPVQPPDHAARSASGANGPTYWYRKVSLVETGWTSDEGPENADPKYIHLVDVAYGIQGDPNDVESCRPTNHLELSAKAVEVAREFLEWCRWAYDLGQYETLRRSAAASTKPIKVTMGEVLASQAAGTELSRFYVGPPSTFDAEGKGRVSLYRRHVADGHVAVTFLGMLDACDY